MTAEIITVRMPDSLMAAVKQHTRADHFSDLSEQMRSIIRKGCKKYAAPDQLSSLKQKLKQELQRESEDAQVQKLLDGIRDILGGKQ